MSQYDYDYEDTPPKPKKKAKPAPVRASRIEIWDVLSVGALLFTALLVVYFAAVFISPNAPYNILKPNNENPNATATPTITPIMMEATWTATVTPEVTAINTLLPTFTAIPSATPFSLIPPTKTPTPSQTPKAPYSASFKGIDSTIIHPEFGCKWQGIGGTIVDANNADMIGMVISLSGYYNGKMRNELTVSGIAPAYGKSGFEFSLGETPLSTKGDLTLQLLDQSSLPLSGPVHVDTYSDCAQNLTLVRFVKIP